MSWDRDFVYIYIYSAIFNCLGVYFIVRSGTGPWARVRSFRLLRGPTVSRAFGEFEWDSDRLTCWSLTDTFQRASCLSIDWDSGLDLAMCVCHIHVHVVCSKIMYFWSGNCNVDIEQCVTTWSWNQGRTADWVCTTMTQLSWTSAYYR